MSLKSFSVTFKVNSGPQKKIMPQKKIVPIKSNSAPLIEYFLCLEKIVMPIK